MLLCICSSLFSVNGIIYIIQILFAENWFKKKYCVCPIFIKKVKKYVIVIIVNIKVHYILKNK